MEFANVMSYLFDGMAAIFNDDFLVFLGEDDEFFYIDIEESGNRYVFTKENNPGVISTYGNSGFFLKDEKGNTHSIARLMLA